MIPIVAIVGRPNVGKSSLFNRLVGRPKAIVHPLPGVTRDRNYGSAVIAERRFTLIDTGGMDPRRLTEDPISVQAAIAMEEADAILFLMDAKAGLNPDDEELLKQLRRSPIPVLYAVNKVDGSEHEPKLADFYRIGKELLGISAAHGYNIPELADLLVATFPNAERLVEEPPLGLQLAQAEARAHEELEAEEEEEEGGDAPEEWDALAEEAELAEATAARSETLPPSEPLDRPLRLAIVGRPNVGKSTLVNYLCGRDRVIVSPEPGTTRDAIDSEITHNGKDYVIIDTAGLRKRRKIHEALEHQMVWSALHAVQRADAVLMLVDAKEGLGDQEVHIAQYIFDSGRAMAVVFNKWDTIEKETNTFKKMVRDVCDHYPFLSAVPFHSMSALTGQRAEKIFDLADSIVTSARRRAATRMVINTIEEIQRHHAIPLHNHRSVKIYFAAQVAIQPPTFLISCSNPAHIKTSWKRYMLRQIRLRLGFEGSPVRIIYKGRGKHAGTRDIQTG